jgi:hypothetical protein
MSLAMWLAGTTAVANWQDSVRAQSAGQVHGNEATVCQARIPHGEADCLSASWDNAGTGSTYSVQNLCSDYGTVAARITVEYDSARPSGYNAYSATRLLSGSSSFSTTLTHADVTNVYCCRGDSDICYRSQVEEDDGRITSLSVSGATVTETEVDVSTYTRRYAFCNDNSSDIYCVVDPEGDALLANCADGPCDVDDCNSQWDLSDASDDCTVESMGFIDDYDNPECTIDATCDDGDWDFRPMDVDLDLVDDMEFCTNALGTSGTLTTVGTSCP